MSKLRILDSARSAAVLSGSPTTSPRSSANVWRGLLLCGLLALLVACGGGEPAPDPNAQTPAGAPPVPAAEPAPADAAVTDPAADPAVDATADTRTPVELFQAAGKALSEERLFEPQGDNAMELYLHVIESAAQPDAAQDESKRRRLSDSVGAGDLKSQAEIAIADIFPYGLLWVDRAIRENRKSEAERVLALLERAQPGADSIARLRQKLTQPEPLPVPAAPATTAQRPTTPAAQPTPPPATSAPATTAPATSAPAAAPATASPAQPDPVAAPPQAEPAPTPAQPAAPVARQDGAPPQLKLRRSASPRYPPRAYRQRIEGYVVVGFTVTASGKVDNVRVISGEPTGVFDRDAMDAVKRFEFEAPGREVTTQQRIDFKMGR